MFPESHPFFFLKWIAANEMRPSLFGNAGMNSPEKSRSPCPLTAWTAEKASDVDALGQTVSTQMAGGRLHLEISLTPVFLETTR